MSATGETHYGWRAFYKPRRRRVWYGPADAFFWVEEPVYELVKGQNHIRATGEHDIDPEIVLGRAIAAALAEDIRQCNADPEKAVRIAADLARHQRWLEFKVNGWAAARVVARGTAARLAVEPAGAGAKGA